eukprot:395311_1
MQTNNKAKYEEKIHHFLYKSGFVAISKITDTLQGNIWKASTKYSNQNVVIKVTNKDLHFKSICISNNAKVCENIIMEKRILKRLSKDKKCPQSIINFKHFFASNNNYFLIMEDGGNNLLDFVIKVHKFLENGFLDIDNWHKLVKHILKQMIECIEYLHSKNICHFDISLENMLISNAEIEY